MKKRAFVSFDYDHDVTIKNLLVGQSRLPDSPFDIVDMSIKAPIDNNWQANARRRIKGCDVVIIICGEHTGSAKGVATELNIAREEGIPYFLLCGYGDKQCYKPSNARITDKIYNWTWKNLNALINGAR